MSTEMRLEDFKDRRAAIAELNRENTRNERFFLIGIAGYYAWLFTHSIPGNGWGNGIVWFLPVIVACLGFWRTMDNAMSIWEAAWYILELEKEEASRGEPNGPKDGWEHFIWGEIRKKPNTQGLSRFRRCIRVCTIRPNTSLFLFWIVMALGTGFVFYLFAVAR